MRTCDAEAHQAGAVSALDAAKAVADGGVAPSIMTCGVPSIVWGLGCPHFCGVRAVSLWCFDSRLETEAARRQSVVAGSELVDDCMSMYL